MLPPVGFDNKTMAQAYEINNIRTNRMLATKLAAGQAMATQQKPQKTLGVGHFPAKLAGADGLHR